MRKDSPTTSALQSYGRVSQHPRLLQIRTESLERASSPGSFSAACISGTAFRQAAWIDCPHKCSDEHIYGGINGVVEITTLLRLGDSKRLHSAPLMGINLNQSSVLGFYLP